MSGPKVAEQSRLTVLDEITPISGHQVQVSIVVVVPQRAALTKTRNAIGKRRGAWNLANDAEEGKEGFLLNHLISELLPGDKRKYSNSDPVTGQAAWFDLRVKIRKAENQQNVSEPQFDTLKPLPGEQKRPKILRFGDQFLPKGSWRRKGDS